MIESSTFKGNSRELSSAGSAVEFIQPWYTPIETTPVNTGMAIGGIGSSYTLTAAATTPVLSFIPGLHVTGEKPTDIALQNWFASERVVSEDASTQEVKVENLAALMVINDFFPLKRSSGDAWILSSMNQAQVEQAIDDMLNCKSLYADNELAFREYETEFSHETLRSLRENAESLEARRLLLLDYFDGNLRFTPHWTSSLSADVECQTLNGVPTYDADALQNQLLYPQAKLDYDSSEHGVKISRLHTNPMVKGDAKACSAPFHYTDFELHNPSAETRVLTLVWLQENMNGFSVVKKRPGVQDAGFVLQKTVKNQRNDLVDLEVDSGKYLGIRQYSDQAQGFGDICGELSFGIIDGGDPDVCVSRKSTFYTDQSANVLESALTTERSNDGFDRGVYTGREALSSALVVRVVLKPGAKKTLNFLQVLDFPEIRLKEDLSWKKYCSFFTSQNRCAEIIEYACSEKASIHAAIDTQVKDLKAVVDQSHVYQGQATEADQFVTMAMNTLSFNADATVWDTEDRFLVRECADYPFFNSLDVYFYGSFALLWLLPEVDTSTMRYFKDAVMRSDETKRRFYIYNNAPTAVLHDEKYEGIRARSGAVIHDLGSPFDPLPDAYDWHNVAEWKDLAPKYNLMLLRNYHFTGDRRLLEECWESVEASLKYLMEMIPKGHHMPLTNGTDDTFDNLCSHGITVYCGSLWIAGLRAAAKIAEILGQDISNDWLALAEQANQQLHQALWDGENAYFHFFSFPFIWDHVQDEELLRQRLGGEMVLGEDCIQSINDFVYARGSVGEMRNSKIEDLLLKVGVSLQGTAFRMEKLVRKAYVLLLAGDALTPEALLTLEKESDDSFGDPLLADTYLEMMGLPTVSSVSERTSVAQKAFATNYKLNSPHCGYANLVTYDGQPKEAFQAQDVWIGVQHSNAASLLLRAEKGQFLELMSCLYENLYQKAKIPFAAPEGFNCSCVLTEELLSESVGPHAQALLPQLQNLGWVLQDGRVSSLFPSEESLFCKGLKDQAYLDGVDMGGLYRTIQTTGLKYTAGRYFRPGMIFALPMLMEQMA